MSDVIVDGRTAVFFLPTAVNINAITVAEFTAGKRLDQYMVPTGLTGFDTQQAEIDNTALSQGNNSNLPGRKSYSGTGLMFKEQNPIVEPITAVSTEGTDGIIVIRDRILSDTAIAAAQKYEAYEVRTGEPALMGRGEANALLRRWVPTPVSGRVSKIGVVAAA